MLIFLCLSGHLERSKDSRVAFSTKKNVKEAESLEASEGRWKAAPGRAANRLGTVL